ncbi:MAG: tyrosine-protein phosphatase [Acidimicrobiales bacterium]
MNLQTAHIVSSRDARTLTMTGHHGVMESPARLLPLVGSYNFRDLGGYPTIDGRFTRWGRLYRSDTLHELTGEDLQLLREIGLACVIDLRTAKEVERTGRGVLGSEPIRYVNLSILPEAGGEQQAAPANEVGEVAERYLSYLEVGKASIVESFAVMSNPDSYPLVFHCHAGKDRTGVLSALVLGCIGVEPIAIIDDYVLTATRLDLILGRLRRDPYYSDKMNDLPPSVFVVEASTMERFLDGLKERFGGPRRWALGAGVSEAQLEAIADLLVGNDT